MAKSKQTNKDRAKTLVAFLLDRTGSMESVKKETIGGFNGYLDELNKKKEGKDIIFHFTQFDTISIDVLADSVPLKNVKKLTEETYQPRGGTPLYDAIGKTIRAIEEKANGHKVLFVTLTDGEENSSSEWTQATIKDLIKEKESKHHWTFSYIGVSPEAWAANQHLAAGTIGASNVLRSTGKNTKRAYARFASATANMVCSVGGQSMSNLYHGQQLDQDEEDGSAQKY